MKKIKTIVLERFREARENKYRDRANQKLVEHITESQMNTALKRAENLRKKWRDK